MDATARAGDFCVEDDARADRGGVGSMWSPEPRMVERVAREMDEPRLEVVSAVLREVYGLGLKAGMSVSAPPPPQPKPPRVKKQDQIADLLRRPEGCMAWEILEATGWPTVNIKRFARAAGLDVRKERVAGNCYRFFGIPADQAARASAV